MKSLSFLIPCYNDETTIDAQVTEAYSIGTKLAIPFEIIVINDSSNDRTDHVLAELTKRIRELRVITHTVNKGYGSTIKELYYAAKKEWLFTIPGDYQVEAKELLKLLPHEKNADIILGWRTDRHDTGIRQHQSRIYNWLISLLFDTKTHDVNSVRLMKSSIMKAIILHGTSAFTDAELIIKTKRLGFTVREIPIGHRDRHGKAGTGGGGKLKVILPTIYEMLFYRLGIL